jgi:signal transduction histidine kinase
VEQTLGSPRHENRNSRVLFDVVSSITEILSDVQMYMPASRSFCAQLPGMPVHIYGNPIQLQQALINLCKNASEATHEGGSITLSIASIERHTPLMMTHGRLDPGRYVQISVKDTGSGIAYDDLPRIFTPYFTTKAGKGGTGLGLEWSIRLFPVSAVQ